MLLSDQNIPDESLTQFSKHMDFPRGAFGKLETIKAEKFKST